MPEQPSAPTGAPTAGARRRPALPFANSGWFFLAGLGLAVLAFWPGYFARLPAGGIGPYVHVHSVLMLLWLGLLIAQPFLVRTGWRRLHRWLGRTTLVLVPAIVVATLQMIHSRMREAGAPGFVEDAEFLFLVLGQVVLFVLAWGLALRWRHRPALHARYMACTLLGLADPVVARLVYRYLPRLPVDQLYQAATLAVICLVIGILIVRERHAAQGRAAFPLMLAAATLFFGLFFTVARSDAWVAFAAWYRGLPLT